ncbi:unnamed protein product [Hymenolepis diminuta]|uniref:Akirin n=1 Tax=Hymenolepis diminuta TaxID=6216 RepID=A0A564YY37_HYMDI|nr:unnamed protein product [Hymenolepis diminuta]
MACVTLKRSAPFEPIGPTSAKRHRCSMNLPCNCQLPAQESIFTPSTRISKEQIVRRIRQDVWRMQRRKVIPKFPPGCLPSASEPSEINNDRPSSSGESATALCSQVISRMREMAIRSPKPESLLSSDTDEASDGSCSPRLLDIPDSPQRAQSPPSSPSPKPLYQDDVPLFTIRQVTTLCHNLIREREEKLREEYDTILCGKLAEQYTALLKFNQDQLSNRFKDAPMSYVS